MTRGAVYDFDANPAWFHVPHSTSSDERFYWVLLWCLRWISTDAFECRSLTICSLGPRSLDNLFTLICVKNPCWTCHGETSWTSDRLVTITSEIIKRCIKKHQGHDLWHAYQRSRFVYAKGNTSLHPIWQINVTHKSSRMCWPFSTTPWWNYRPHAGFIADVVNLYVQ